MAKAKPLSPYEVVKDLRAGLDDAALMTKYGISGTQLQGVLQKLVDKRFVERSELNARTEYLARKKAEAENNRWVHRKPDTDETSQSSPDRIPDLKPGWISENKLVIWFDVMVVAALILVIGIVIFGHKKQSDFALGTSGNPPPQRKEGYVDCKERCFDANVTLSPGSLQPPSGGFWKIHQSDAGQVFVDERGYAKCMDGCR